MSLLFGSGHQLLPVTFSVTAEHSEEFVELSRSAWDALSDAGDRSIPEPGTEKLAIVIEPASGPSRRASHCLSSLVEWAVLGDLVRYGQCHS